MRLILSLCRTAMPLAFIGAISATAAAAEEAATLRIGGTGAALATMTMLGEAFREANPGSTVVVLPSLGSGGGIKALAAERIEVAVSARPLTNDEKAAGLVAWEYARTPMVFATRADTAAEAVTSAELVDIYAGRLTTWPDGSRLRLVMRPATETDTAFLRSLSPEMDKAVEAATGNPALFVAINDQDNAKAIEDIRGSIGLIALGQMLSEGRKLKPLAIDGLSGTVEALDRGTYPYAKRLYLIVRSPPAPTTEAFLRFVGSAAGQRILAAAGYLTTGPAPERIGP